MGIEMAECEDEELYGKEYLQWKKQTLDKQVNHYLKKFVQPGESYKKDKWVIIQSRKNWKAEGDSCVCRDAIWEETNICNQFVWTCLQTKHYFQK